MTFVAHGEAMLKSPMCSYVCEDMGDFYENLCGIHNEVANLLSNPALVLTFGDEDAAEAAQADVYDFSKKRDVPF